MGCSNRCSNASSSLRDGLFSTGLLTVVPRFTGSDTHISHEKEKYVAKCSCIMIHNYVTIILAFHTKGEHVVKTIYRVEYRWIRLSQKTLKSNFAQDEAFLFFISRPKLLFVWLILQRISQKRVNRISAKWNIFSPYHTRTSQSWQVYFNVECLRISNLAAGQLDALQHKPFRLVVVVCYRFCQCLLSVCFCFITY